MKKASVFNTALRFFNRPFVPVIISTNNDTPTPD
jgi:hypothetical protein